MIDKSAVVQLKYLSVTSASTHISDLIKIIEVAIPVNAKNQISGILFFDQGYFGQIIEGPKAAVDETWNRIKDDKRHTNVELLGIQDIQQRQFPKWSMKLFDGQAFAVEFPKFAELITLMVDPSAETLRVLRVIWQEI